MPGLPYQNRGITQIPEARYQELIGYYNQGPPARGGTPDSSRARVGGGGQNTATAQQGGGYMDLFGSMPFSLFGPPQAQARSGGGNPHGSPVRTSRLGPATRGNQPYYGYAPQPGYSPSQNYAPTQPQSPPADLPPATTNPQTPLDPNAGLGTYTNPITAGLLDQGLIDQGSMGLLQSMGRSINLPGGGQASGLGSGLFGQLMGQSGNRANLDFLENAQQQQADMRFQHDTAKSNAGLQQAGLLAGLNRENVTNSVAQRNAMLNLVSAILGGLG